MKKIIFFAVALVSVNTFAQKADVDQYEVEVTFDQPEVFKNFKTISYELQDDGVFWNYEPTETKPTLTDVTQGIEIAGLETVNENADLNFVVAFKGGKPSYSPALVAIEGTYLFLLKTPDNKIISLDREFVKYNANASEYSFKGSKAEQKVTYAKIITEYANKYLGQKSYLISGKSSEKLPFGVFKKTKGGAAASFTDTSKPLIDAIIANPTDVDGLDSAIAYWEEQLNTDFGKKVKEKAKSQLPRGKPTRHW